jgi:NAD-dependent deacetylase
MRDTDLREAARLIDRAERIVIFTGAGVSAESGIPTFRDALTGLWEQFDPRRLATPEAFGDDPALVWGWYEGRRAAVERVAEIPQVTARMGGTVIQVNPDPTPLDPVARINLHGAAAEVLPALVSM